MFYRMIHCLILGCSFVFMWFNERKDSCDHHGTPIIKPRLPCVNLGIIESTFDLQLVLTLSTCVETRSNLDIKFYYILTIAN